MNPEHDNAPRNQPEPIRAFWRMRSRREQTALILVTATTCALLLLSLVHGLTREHIADAQRQLRRAEREAVLPSLRFPVEALDLASDISVPNTGVTSSPEPDKRLVVSRVRDTTGGTATLIEAIAAQGYNGPITLLIGLRDNGVIDGVRVLEHRETPGLGDPIERRRSTWIEQFRNRSLDNTPSNSWSVRRPDSAFEALTGATITSAAVVRGVHDALTASAESADVSR